MNMYMYVSTWITKVVRAARRAVGGAAARRRAPRCHRAFGVAGLAASLALVAGCGGSSGGDGGADEPVTLRFAVWSDADDHQQMFEGFAAEYKETHPDVSVEFVFIPFGEYQQKVNITLAGGKPFDGGWLGEDMAPVLAEQGALVDLASAMGETNGYDLADFAESSMTNWSDGEAVYGVPFSTSPSFLYFNKDLFAAADLDTPDVLAERGEWTWERFEETADTISKAADQGTYGFQPGGPAGGFYEQMAQFWSVAPAIYGYGGATWDTSGACLLDSPETVDAIALFQRMSAEGAMPPPGQNSLFDAGQAGMTFSQLSRTSQLAEAAFDWGIAPLPSGPEGIQTSYGQAGIVAFSRSAHPDVAAEFVAFMTGKENVETMSQFFPPARKSVLKSDTFLNNNAVLDRDDMAMIAGLVDQIRPNSFGSDVSPTEIDTALKPSVDKLWESGADAQSIMSEACDAIELLLKQN